MMEILILLILSMPPTDVANIEVDCEEKTIIVTRGEWDAKSIAKEVRLKCIDLDAEYLIYERE